MIGGHALAGERYSVACESGALNISVVTVAELLYGAYRVGSARRLELLEGISSFLSDLELVIPVTSLVSETWALLKREAELRGRAVASNDLWIAATAAAHDMILVAHDRDFEGIPDLRLEDWVV